MTYYEKKKKKILPSLDGDHREAVVTLPSRAL